MVGDAFEGVFLRAGHYMNKVGETAEAKIGFGELNPFQNLSLRRRLQLSLKGGSGIAFLMPSCPSPSQEIRRSGARHAANPCTLRGAF
jgi:hypothetical protein